MMKLYYGVWYKDELVKTIHIKLDFASWLLGIEGTKEEYDFWICIHLLPLKINYHKNILITKSRFKKG